MWMLPILNRICSTAIRIYYRFETSGEEIPKSGPLILVANHPNGIVDAICVVAAAGRPVRFLAKKPLFHYPILGTLVRGSGAIPVYRKQDFPGEEVDNSRMFEVAHDEICKGAALGLFPEGISHDQPSLSTLKTGAARIALGAAAKTPEKITIVPIGLNIRQKERFRSRALALVGGAVEWDDLRDRDADDADAVRVLTDRIDAALRHVTLNVEEWEDIRLVEYAEAIWSAERGLERDVRHEARIEVTRALARLRTENPAAIQPVVDAIDEFARLLEMLRLRPRHLDAEPSIGGAVRWTILKLIQLALSVPVLAAGYLVYLLPYLAVVSVNKLTDVPRDVRSTVKFFAGALIYLPWIALLTTLVWWTYGWKWGTVALAGLPLLGVATQLTRERWSKAILAARRYLTLRKSALRDRLRAQRTEIAQELEKLRRAEANG